MRAQPIGTVTRLLGYGVAVEVRVAIGIVVGIGVDDGFCPVFVQPTKLILESDGTNTSPL